MRVVITIAIVAMTMSSGLAESFDLEKLKTKIAQEPSYMAKQPLYGFAVVGKAGESRMWMVLDKSKAENEQYDVAYVDLNGNGNLAEPNERFTSTQEGRRSFALPEIVDPSTKERHAEFKLSVSSRQPATHMVSMMWRGKHKIGGGYPADPDGGYMQFADSPEKAPIVWINGDGPFRFQRWYSGEFRIGESDDLKVFLGQMGIGNSSFCAFQRHVLPVDEPVNATLIYSGADGNERQMKCKLKERC
jgi:hypothetical protein